MFNAQNIIKLTSENYDLRKNPKGIFAVMLHYTDTKNAEKALDILVRNRDKRLFRENFDIAEVSSHYLIADYNFNKILKKETKASLEKYLEIIDKDNMNEEFSFVLNLNLRDLLKICLKQHRSSLLKSLQTIIMGDNLEDIVIFELLSPEYRARHAGKGRFRDILDFNEISIGIEIQNEGPKENMPEFPEKQKQAVIALCEHLKNNFPTIDRKMIIGHADYAPHRKIDPGEKLDIWEKLASKNLGMYHDIIEKNQVILARSGDVGENISKIQQKLQIFGYDLEVTGEIDIKTANVIWAFHSHFNQKITENLVWEGGKYEKPFPNDKKVSWTDRDDKIIDQLISKYPRDL